MSDPKEFAQRAINSLIITATNTHQACVTELRAIPESEGGWSPEKSAQKQGFFVGIFDITGECVAQAYCGSMPPGRNGELFDSAQGKAANLFTLRRKDSRVISTWEKRHLVGVQGGAILIMIAGEMYALVGAGLPSQMDHLIMTDTMRRSATSGASLLDQMSRYTSVVKQRANVLGILQQAAA